MPQTQTHILFPNFPIPCLQFEAKQAGGGWGVVSRKMDLDLSPGLFIPLSSSGYEKH